MIDHATLFYPGGCDLIIYVACQMACVVKIIFAQCTHKSTKTMREIIEKMLFQPTDPSLFHNMKLETQVVFFRPKATHKSFLNKICFTCLSLPLEL